MRHRLLAVMLALAACDQPPAPAQSNAPAPVIEEGRAADARRAVEQRLRDRLRIPGDLRTRAVMVHRQALAETLAVCGHINPSGRSDDPFIPFVGVAHFDRQGRVERTEVVLGLSSQEATRTYFELVDRCHDGGGPAQRGQRVLPPLPSEFPRTAPTPPSPPAPATAAPVAAPAPTPTTAPATGSVTTTSRHPVNVRAAPQGGSAVVRIVPRSSTLQVLGSAPGGWLQVGENGEAMGWLHSSLLESP